MPTWGPTSIQLNADDGYNDGNGSSWTSTAMFCGATNGTYPHHIGVFWDAVTVPAGATITSATVSLVARSLAGTVTNVHGTWYGNDVDDAVAFTGTGPGGMAQTTASTAFNPSAWTVDTRYSYDVTTIIAEIIARAGWASGNGIGLGLLNNGSSDASYCRAWDVNDAEGKLAELTIVYTAGGSLTIVGRSVLDYGED